MAGQSHAPAPALIPPPLPVLCPPPPPPGAWPPARRRPLPLSGPARRRCRHPAARAAWRLAPTRRRPPRCRHPAARTARRRPPAPPRAAVRPATGAIQRALRTAARLAPARRRPPRCRRHPARPARRRPPAPPCAPPAAHTLRSRPPPTHRRPPLVRHRPNPHSARLCLPARALSASCLPSCPLARCSPPARAPSAPVADAHAVPARQQP